MVSLGWKITERVKVGEQRKGREVLSFIVLILNFNSADALSQASQLLGGHKCFNKYILPYISRM